MSSCLLVGTIFNKGGARGQGIGVIINYVLRIFFVRQHFLWDNSPQRSGASSASYLEGGPLSRVAFILVFIQAETKPILGNDIPGTKQMVVSTP